METHGQHCDPSALAASARRIVIKVGSALVVDQAGTVAAAWLSTLAEDIARLRARGVDVLIVSSGAVALGASALDMVKAGVKPLRLEEKQAAASVGQLGLMDAWRAAFSAHGLTMSQILLTLSDTENRRRYLNARATLETLLGLGVIPIVNENDTVATDEIRYGDNDRLAAHLAQMASADLLVMLSDVDGLYEDDPRTTPEAAHIPIVTDIDEAIIAMAGGPNAQRGTGSGGMATKIDAARIAVNAGCATIVGRGDRDNPINAISNGARCTVFAPISTPENARRSWIAGRIKPSGSVHIDAGALAALRDGASLLPAGVTRVEAPFAKGDAISIKGPDGAFVATGLSAYDSNEVDQITGLKSEQVEAVLGYRRAALVHRNDLVISSL